MIPEKDWIWLGYPGHLCVSPWCMFRMATEVGDFLISTVGDYRVSKNYPTGKPETIGCDRLYETYVFELSSTVCECGCGARLFKGPAREIASRGANDSLTARQNHMEFCRRYANREELK